MSISQVKKQFEELAAYLGRDVPGLDRLRKLKDAVNVLRTNLAAAGETTERATKQASQAVAETVAAKTALAEARLELHNLRQRLNNLARELAATVEDQPTEEDKDCSDVGGMPLTSDISQFRATLKRLRKRLPVCPKTVGVIPLATYGDVGMFDRVEFAKGWAYDDLWTLGACVALLTAFRGAVLVRNHELFKDMKATNHSASLMLMKWLSDNMTTPPTDPVTELGLD